MRSIVMQAGTLLGLAALCSVSFGQGEAPGPAGSADAMPGTLEDAITRALEFNPDIVAAKADLRYTQAKLRQVRLKTSQAVAAAYHRREACKLALEGARDSYTRIRQLVKAGAADQETEHAHRQALFEAEAAYVLSETEMHYLVGQNPTSAKIPRKLEDVLKTAMQSNADIELAAAEVAQAEAKLNRYRLKVTQDITTAFHMKRVRRNALEDATRALALIRQRVKQGVVSESEQFPAVHAMFEAEAALVRLEADLRYLMGVGKASSSK